MSTTASREGDLPEQIVEGDPSASVAPRRKHLYEVDILRILTFACVIAVHAVSHAAGPDDVVQNGFLVLVHFTREVFFALTAFVLVYSFQMKPRPLKEFWPRRFLLVGVPYISWSAIYVFSNWVHDSTRIDGLQLLDTFWYDLYTGTAWYHLYFLLVTMQVYLLLPVLVWLVAKTRRFHVLVVVVAFVFQLLVTASYLYDRSFTAPWNKYQNIEFWSYLFMIVVGAVAADHRVQLLSWVRAHRIRIAWIALAGAVLSIGVYAFNLSLGYGPSKAATALQPVTIVWSVPVILGFLALGTKWADQRVAGSRMARLVDTASDRSFGIFLAHPYMIWLLLAGGGWLAKTIPSPWLSPVLYVLVVVTTVALIEIVRRTPLSLALTGRPYRSRKTKAAAVEAAAAKARA
ncbi:hypothetical protein AX769_10770 [Frondihabitans sp. PAMC 28766]|uniref:acyltransferase n=1 Tax=Frondihabitans sp. PAMC 28766 TaxID=1795630 RepID=UPI00078D1E5F|nr:acyltransferase [Frondihabitans sp. PAMC 28766]AMM20541.1 hypothetical protein AX769_10770 [Frondihabitans sp. PAMC 28766]